MAKMKAVCLESFGGPETLHVKDVEIPQPGEGEVLIRVRAASVNPVDFKIREGKYPPVSSEQLPKVLGRDISGTVERCGRAVTQFKEADEVFAMLDPEHGGYAEYVVLRADLCARKPRSLNHVEAAAVPLAGLTAWQGLFDHGKLRAGQHVLIHGGAGGVGHLAIQFAKARGARVSTTVSWADKEFARTLGADQVVDHHAERFEDVVHDVDLVFDLVAGETQQRSWAVLKKGGTLVSTLTRPPQEEARRHEARGLNYTARPDAAELSDVGRLIDAGKVKPRVQETFPLAQAAAAQQRLQRGHVPGKIVLQVQA